MKRFLFLPMILMLFMWGCKKELPETPVTNTVELEFQIDKTSFEDLKSGADTVPLCSELPMHYAEFEVNGYTYTKDIYQTATGLFMTHPLKIELGQNTSEVLMLTKFLVYYDAIPIGPGPEDTLVRAAPAPGSIYWDLMTHQLDIEISVEAFKKTEVIVDVLCFEDLYYDNFGFVWFELNLIKIERQAWFGDVCNYDLEVYEGSLYEGQENGLQEDMPLIMKVDISKLVESSWVLQRSFDNIAWLGEGAPLEVYWANDEDLPEDFKMDVYAWLPDNLGVFMWILYESYEFLDGDCPDPGDDGVNDIYIDNCSGVINQTGACTWEFDLPPGTFTMELDNPGSHPSALGFYIDVDLQGFGSGYDIPEGWQGTWCGNNAEFIAHGQTYTVTAIGSVGSPVPPGLGLSPIEMRQVDYMYNHIHDVMPGFNYGFPGGDWSAVQNAVWYLTNASGPLPPGDAADLANNAILNAPTWDREDGDYAMVYLFAADTVQPLFIPAFPECIE